MNAQPLEEYVGRDLGEADNHRALHVFIAYGDVVAGQRAMHVLADLGKGLGDAIEFRPTPWPFQVLINAHWREAAARAAVEADILMIAASGTHPCPSEVQQWIEAILPRKQGTDSAIVALLGTREESAEVTSFSIHTIQTAAKRAGLAFFAPVTHEKLPRVHHYAEMFHRLHPHHRPPRWGINE